MKKLIKIIIATVLLVMISMPSQALSAVKLNKSKATMEIGSTLKLKVSDTEDAITWKTSKKSVATVSKAGTVTAKSEGQAIITATVNKKSYECKITVVDSNKKVVLVDVGETIELLKGLYVVGEDIDAGKYDLTAIDNWGRVKVFVDENSSKTVMSEQLDVDEAPTYSNLTLKEGNIVEISYNIKVGFSRKK